jgi:hypothetical protein
MKRFLDLRGQIYLDDDLPLEERYVVFAFYDTSSDKIESFDDEQVFESWQDFEHAFTFEAARKDLSDLERYRGLCPEWVFVKKAADS